MENLGSYLLHVASIQESFFVCVKRGDLRYLTELLTKDPEAINAREEVGLHHREKDRRRGSFLPVCVCVCVIQTGQTLLHHACALGQLEIVIYLLNRRDCSVSEQDDVSTCKVFLLCIRLCYTSFFSATCVCVCVCVDIPTHSSAHGVHVQPKQSGC